MVQLLQDKLEITVLAPSAPDIAGALGAALYALEGNGGQA
jgi:activator of 2-hydroxyglutaryl-CoA dehydratase